MDPDKFFNIFLINNKVDLFFSTKKFELKIKAGLEINNASVFVKISQKIKATHLFYKSNFYAWLYSTSLISESKVLLVNGLLDTTEDIVVS